MTKCTYCRKLTPTSIDIDFEPYCDVCFNDHFITVIL